MPLIDKNGKLLGLVNLLDAVIIGAVVVAGVGMVSVRAGYTAVDKMGTKGPAEIDLLIRANIEDLSMFKVGDKAFVTIRNQPYDKVLITKVQAHRQQIAVPTHDGRDFRITTDPTTPYASEVLLTLRDEGMETEDGIVWGGQKLKLGVPIDVEGLKYRLRGSVIDVRMVKEAKQ
jgi:hypothetical protein